MKLFKILAAPGGPKAKTGEAVCIRNRRILTKPEPVCLVGTLAIVGMAAYFLLTGGYLTKAATDSWLQTDWSGAADTVSDADATNAAGGAWTNYFFKSSNVDTATAGEVKLNAADSATVKTTDADFNAGNVPLSMRVADGGVTLKKQDGRPCAAAAECVSAVCTTGTSGVCGNWYYGYCDNIAIHNGSYYSYWKNSATACVAPQCDGSGVLVADNNQTFNDYSARNYCKTLGGRLPSMAELACIGVNRAHMPNIVNTVYWSNREYDVSRAYAYDFTDAGEEYPYKYNNYYYVCVKDI